MATVYHDRVGHRAVLTTEDGWRSEFLVTGMTFRPYIDTLDLTDFGSPPRIDHVYHGTQITIEGRADGRPQEALSDAEALAWAVIRGDQQAALILADEVQMAYQQAKTFVPREELIRILKDWADYYQLYWPAAESARLAFEQTEDILDKTNRR